jgi:hypothetical protein
MEARGEACHRIKYQRQPAAIAQLLTAGAYIAVASVAAYGRLSGQNLQPRSGLQKSGMLLAFRLSFGLAAKADDLAVRYLVQPLFIACELRG